MESARVRHRRYGKQIKMRLLEMDMTQKELAELIGLEQRRVSDILRGVFPGLKHRAKIADVLEMPFEENNLQSCPNK